MTENDDIFPEDEPPLPTAAGDPEDAWTASSDASGGVTTWLVPGSALIVFAVAVGVCGAFDPMLAFALLAGGAAVVCLVALLGTALEIGALALRRGSPWLAWTGFLLHMSMLVPILAAVFALRNFDRVWPGVGEGAFVIPPVVIAAASMAVLALGTCGIAVDLRLRRSLGHAYEPSGIRRAALRRSLVTMGVVATVAVLFVILAMGGSALNAAHPTQLLTRHERQVIGTWQRGPGIDARAPLFTEQFSYYPDHYGEERRSDDGGKTWTTRSGRWTIDYESAAPMVVLTSDSGGSSVFRFSRTRNTLALVDPNEPRKDTTYRAVPPALVPARSPGPLGRFAGSRLGMVVSSFTLLVIVGWVVLLTLYAARTDQGGPTRSVRPRQDATAGS